MGHCEHKKRAPAKVDCAVLTVSDTRTQETDSSGRLIKEMLAQAGHGVKEYSIVRDEPDQIREHVMRFLTSGAVRTVIVNGGTGLSKRDTTYEAIQSLIEKRIDGFGEIFRSLSYQEIGSSAIMSRAQAGTVGNCVVFSLPGSEAAVKLAMEKIILPELGHLIYELEK